MSTEQSPADWARMEQWLITTSDDRFDRFLASCSENSRSFIEDIVRRKHEIERLFISALTETDQALALESAEWVRRNVRGLAREWLLVRRAFAHWIERHDGCPASFEIAHKNGDPTDNSIDNLELRRTP